MAAARAKTLSTLRTLLREVNLQYTSRNGNLQWRTFLMDSFRENKNETDPTRLAQLRGDAADLAVFLRSNRKQDELIKYYNEPIIKKDMVERTANLVGFKLPKTYEEPQPN